MSVPIVTAARLVAAAAADPLDEPLALRSSTYGLRVWPPTAPQPAMAIGERKLAHSVMFALPRTTAPASRSRRTSSASLAGRAADSAVDPAVVGCRSAVSMFSLSSTGMPSSGPRDPWTRRARSLARAMAAASGLTVTTAPRRGFRSRIRSR